MSSCCHVSALPGSVQLGRTLEVWPHQCRVQENNHFPSPAGHTIPDTGQDVTGLLGHLGTRWIVFSCCHQHLQGLFCQTASQPLPPACSTAWGCCDPRTGPSTCLVESPTAGFSPSIQPVQIPLQGLPAFQQINTPAQLGVACKLTEGGT